MGFLGGVDARHGWSQLPWSFFKLNFPDNLYTRFQNRQGKAPGRNGTQTSKLNMAISEKCSFVFWEIYSVSFMLVFPNCQV